MDCSIIENLETAKDPTALLGGDPKSHPRAAGSARQTDRQTGLRVAPRIPGAIGKSRLPAGLVRVKTKFSIPRIAIHAIAECEVVRVLDSFDQYKENDRIAWAVMRPR
jgi:hypothetical protein